MRAAAWLVLLLGSSVLPGAEDRVRFELLPWLDHQLKGLETWRPPTLCKVLDASGATVDEFALIRRDWVDLDDVPESVWSAVLAAEDRRFFDHHGVDLIGIARAVWVNLAAGAIREGGSTLTQQLVKNVVLSNERSFSRKAVEALLAWRLEQHIDKRRVLELYLNYVYLGSGNYGLQAAAQDYFGVDASELDPGQAALIAGLIPAPSRYSPRRDPEEARRRRRMVLDSMVEEGFVDVLDAQLAKRTPVDPPRRSSSEGRVGTAYFTSVRREVRRLLGSEIPFQAGLRVHTPYVPELQDVAERAVREAAEAVEKRQGHPGALRTLDEAATERFLEASAMREAPQVGECTEVVHLGGGRLGVGSLRLTFAPDTWARRVWNPDTEEGPQPLSVVARLGDVFDVCVGPKGTAELREEPWIEGSAIVMRVRDGAVLAVVGGRDMALEGFHRATQALRQAGSSFKPYVYAAALDAGWSQIDKVLDAPLSLPGGNGKTWSPKNYTGGYAGALPMRRAFAQSLNTVAVRLALDVGIDPIVDLAMRAGVQSPLRRDLTIALGSSEVTVLDQARGITTMVRGGVPVEPVWVEQLVDVTGRQVGRAGQMVDLPGLNVRLPGKELPPAMRASTAWQMVELMRTAVKEGTGRSAYVEGLERGGKTGTTSGYADAWFVGFTAEHVIVTWIGRDDRRALGFGETGGRSALPAWKAIATALGEPPGTALSPPPSVLRVPWQGQWVGVAAADVPHDALDWELRPDQPLDVFPGTEACAASDLTPR